MWGKINSCQSYPHSSCHGAAPIKAGDSRQSRGAEHFLRMIDSWKPLLEISKIFSHQSSDLSVTQRTGMIKKTKCDPQTVVTLFHIWNKVTTYMLLWIGDRQKISGLPLSTMTKSTCIDCQKYLERFCHEKPREILWWCGIKLCPRKIPGSIPAWSHNAGATSWSAGFAYRRASQPAQGGKIDDRCDHRSHVWHNGFQMVFPHPCCHLAKRPNDVSLKCTEGRKQIYWNLQSWS